MNVTSRRTEKLLLCAMMEQRKVLRYTFPRLSPGMFGLEEHKEIFERLVTLVKHGKGVPSVKIMAQDPGLSAEAKTVLSIEGKERVKASTLRREDVEHCINNLKYYQKKRVVYETIKLASESLETTARVDVNALTGRMIDRLSQLEDKVEGSRIIGAGGNVSDAYLKERLKDGKDQILKTGYPSIDGEIKGFGRGNLVLLTAPRGEGKSLLAKSLSFSHYYQKANVFVANLEMEEWEYLLRLFAEESSFSHERLRRGNFQPKSLKKIMAVKRDIDAWGRKNNCKWHLRTISNPAYSPITLHNELKNQGYDVIIVDYLNMLASSNKRNDLWMNIYEATKYLKMMAKDLNALVYVLGQLNEDDRAKYARAAEEDADVWILWNFKHARRSPYVLFRHGKARHYDPFNFRLIFDGKKTRFLDPSDVDSRLYQRIERDIERRRKKDEDAKKEKPLHERHFEPAQEDKPKTKNKTLSKKRKKGAKKNAS